MTGEVGPGGARCLDLLDNSIGINVRLADGEDVFNILGSLLNITLDIHGETGSLWDSETEVESDYSRYTTKTDEDTPHEVDRAMISRSVTENAIFVGRCDDEGDEGSGCVALLISTILLRKGKGTH